MTVSWDDNAWDDYLWWQVHDRSILKRINRMISESSRDPGFGIGKPEKLRENLSGYWSRRITDEHRLVYRVADDGIFIMQCKYHY
ncbi:MAG: Txe/YoeB family addiction module toxin [Promicromonosporaceae bacterium]|nr:Txe/YoeB family addiction module toxin [Promicromonosporaceae bacterium]